jgi:hypothetical protein
VIEPLGVPGGDVPGNALVEPELAEEAVRRREPLLAVEPFLLDRGELRR